MFYYKGAFRETDNVIYFKSDVSLAQNDVVLFGEKEVFYRKCGKRISPASAGGLHCFCESVKSSQDHPLFQVYMHFWATAYIQ